MRKPRLALCLHSIAVALLITACAENDSWLLADGAKLSRTQLLQQTVIVNYWAEWCKPCAKEIPELNRLHEKLLPAQRVLGINYDGVGQEELSRLINKFNIQFPIFVNDPSTALQLPRPKVLPTTYILNTQGKIIHTLIGPQTEESLHKVIQGLH